MEERQRRRERRRGWRNGREGTKEVEDRAHFSAVLSNGTSSISPKRSLQSTKLLISNERPWNTVAKQLGGLIEQLIPAAQCPSLQFFLNLIDFLTDEQQPAPSDHAHENGLLWQGCKLHRHPYFTQYSKTPPKQVLLRGHFGWMCVREK